METHQKIPVLRSIRAYCLDCMAGSRKLVDECWDKKCGLYPYRRAILSQEEASSVDAVDVCEGVANRCVNCAAGLFKDCDITDCPLNKRIKTVIEVAYDRKRTKNV